MMKQEISNSQVKNGKDSSNIKNSTPIEVTNVLYPDKVATFDLQTGTL